LEKMAKIYLKFNKMIKEYSGLKKNYSVKIAMLNLLYVIFGYIPILYKIRFKIFNAKSNYILKYLNENYSEIISKFRNIEFKHSENHFKSDSIPIWVFWYQDIQTAPELVRGCVENIVKKNVGTKYKVTLISKDNLSDYIKLPKYIYDKVETGIIELALFSDIIRICLIAKYGGIWIDSTCYCTSPIPLEVQKYPFYSCKSLNWNSALISHEQWANYCLASNQSDYILYNFLREILFEYWKVENYPIDYLLTDYLIRIAYNSVPVVKEDIDNLPDNNLNRGKLLGILNNEYDPKKLKELNSNTWLYKLTYKHAFVKRTNDKTPTFYSVLITDNLEEHSKIELK
jgi:hypothetical protein